MELLRAEGVVFDGHGRADQVQRLTVDELAELAGLDLGEQDAPSPWDEDGHLPGLTDRFIEQLVMQQDPETAEAVAIVLESWTAMGGMLGYGAGEQTSCFLLARDKTHPDGNIWPIAIYPLRSCEVVFQHLASRKPFDDIQLREELRQRLNEIPGVNLPESKIALRPAFPLTVLGDAAARDTLIGVLAWFLGIATGSNLREGASRSAATV